MSLLLSHVRMASPITLPVIHSTSRNSTSTFLISLSCMHIAKNKTYGKFFLIVYISYLICNDRVVSCTFDLGDDVATNLKSIHIYSFFGCVPGILRTIGKIIGKDSSYFSIKPYQLNKVALHSSCYHLPYHPYGHARLSLVCLP